MLTWMWPMTTWMLLQQMHLQRGELPAASACWSSCAKLQYVLLCDMDTDVTSIVAAKGMGRRASTYPLLYTSA
jgi:hypothetical protein